MSGRGSASGARANLVGLTLCLALILLVDKLLPASFYTLATLLLALGLVFGLRALRRRRRS